MIMKKLLIISLIGLSLVSCEKWLEEAPKQVAEQVFYNTAEEVESAVNAIFTPLRDNTVNNSFVTANYIATLEVHSDWMYGRGSWDPLGQYQGLNDVNITRVSGFWEGFYVAIRNANLVILNAPNGNSISQEDIQRYVAEARFLRAFTYFQLVRNWGAIPLRIETNMNEKDVPRSSEQDVYALIVADLSDAVANLPDVPAQFGRPTRGAARTLLADVYLQLQQYNEAASLAQEVIQSNRYSLVSISSARDIQYNIFGPTILTSSEEIFALKYSRLQRQGNYLLWISNHPSTGLFRAGGAYAVHGDATNPNYVNWDEDDFRKDLWDQIDFGLGPNTLVSSKYVDPDALDQNGAGNDQPLYRYADVLLIYAEASARAQGTVTPAAMEALNSVRRRAYGHSPATPSAVDFVAADYDAQSFIDLVIRERGYEFIYEGKRWLDLKRLGRVDEFILYGKGKTVSQMHLLWPIPLSELNYNDALNPSVDQNPGY